MKTKKEVYVVVDTPKKAKKLGKVLDMFGEKETYPGRSINDALEAKELVHYNNDVIIGWAWTDHDLIEDENKTEVTIKELRSILAEEKLKHGDVVVCKNSRGKWIQKIGDCPKLGEESIKKVFIDGLKHETEYCYGFIKLDEFLRYATEEEKALLHGEETKPELEAGKWYKYIPKDTTFYVTKIEDWVYAYGINYEQEWIDNKRWMPNEKDHLQDIREATPQEVEQALIKEAKRRYKVGDIARCLHGCTSYDTKIDWKFEYDHRGAALRYAKRELGAGCLYYKGKWAEVVKESPKFEVEIDGDAIKGYVEKFHSDERGDSHTVSARLGKYQGSKSKLYYKYNSECQLVFIRSSVSPINGEWNIYSGKDINELI